MLLIFTPIYCLFHLAMQLRPLHFSNTATQRVLEFSRIHPLYRASGIMCYWLPGVRRIISYASCFHKGLCLNWYLFHFMYACPVNYWHNLLSGKFFKLVFFFWSFSWFSLYLLFLYWDFPAFHLFWVCASLLLGVVLSLSHMIVILRSLSVDFIFSCKLAFSWFLLHWVILSYIMDV